jgi:hypothetical protein
VFFVSRKAEINLRSSNVRDPRRHGKASETGVCIGSAVKAFREKLSDKPCAACGHSVPTISKFCGQCAAKCDDNDAQVDKALETSKKGFKKHDPEDLDLDEEDEETRGYLAARMGDLFDHVDKKQKVVKGASSTLETASATEGQKEVAEVKPQMVAPRPYAPTCFAPQQLRTPAGIRAAMKEALMDVTDEIHKEAFLYWIAEDMEIFYKASGHEKKGTEPGLFAKSFVDSVIDVSAAKRLSGTRNR